MIELDRVLVVGGSLAGLRAAETLRQEGFEGDVTVIGDEPHLPYDRPPLSKEVLTGKWEPERAFLRKVEVYDNLDVEWALGRAAGALDLETREVVLIDGERLAFDGLIIATGSSPRRLRDQPDLAGVFTLRTVEDAVALRDALGPGRRVVVVGAGFIGAEVAASAHARGCTVTVLEALPVPLERALGPDVGARCGRLHGAHGVELRTGVGVSGLVDDGSGRVAGVSLVDGTQVDADVVVVGIGVVPNTAWLEGSGLELRDGVVCDATLWTGAPGVYAAGDVARWPHATVGREIRIEHWSNANEQGQAAARNLLAGDGLGTPVGALPFFWSDQYELRIQLFGHADPADAVHVALGDEDDHKLLVFYAHDGRVTAGLAVGMPRQLARCRGLIEAGVPVDEAVAAARAL